MPLRNFGPYEVEVVVSDADGTIIPDSSGNEVSKKLLTTLRQLSWHGKQAERGLAPPFAVCSGRDYGYLCLLAKFLNNPNAWWLAEGGAIAFNPATDELLENPHLLPDQKTAFRKAIAQRIPSLLARFPGFRLYPGKQVVVTLELRPSNKDLTTDQAFEAINEMFGDCIQDGIMTATRSGNAVDLFPAHFSKRMGLSWLCEMTEADPKRVLAIGNSPGDLPLLVGAGLVGVPANAEQECLEFVRQQGDRGYVSSRSLAKGVIDIIQHFTQG